MSSKKNNRFKEPTKKTSFQQCQIKKPVLLGHKQKHQTKVKAPKNHIKMQIQL